MKSLLTPMQLSEFLQVKLSTVYKWTHYGYVPCYKVGGSIRFDIEEIQKWLKKCFRKGRSSYKPNTYFM
jgi:excisionase family DNA binding protein